MVLPAPKKAISAPTKAMAEPRMIILVRPNFFIMGSTTKSMGPMGAMAIMVKRAWMAAASP